MKLAFLITALSFYVYVIGGYWYGKIADRIHHSTWRHFRFPKEQSNWKPWRY